MVRGERQILDHRHKLKAGTKSKLAVSGLATIVCTAATAQAVIEQENVLVSPFTIKKLGIKFTGCTVEGHESECTAQSGATAGEIVVEELVSGEVLDEGEGCRCRYYSRRKREPS